jgi:tape measure domain-containing protein
MPSKNVTYKAEIIFAIRNKTAEGADGVEKQLTRTDKRVKALVETLKKYDKLLQQVEKAEAALGKAGGFVAGGGSSSSPSSSRGGFDNQMRKAQADIARIQQQNRRAESSYTDFVSREAEKQFRARTSHLQRGYSEFQKILDKEKAATANQSRNVGGGGSGSSGGIFGAVFGGNIAANAVSQVTSLLKEGGSAILEYSSKIEQARIGFTTLTGSVQAADQHIRDLQDFAKKTPFDFGGLVKDSQLLQGVGIEAKRVIPILSDVGNALSAAGKGNEEIERTVLAISQITSKGKLAGQEINQLAENGISAVTILSQTLGKSKGEIIKLSEAGQISSELFLAALHKFVEANHIGDAMEKQSHTFNGALSNIIDSLYQGAEKAFKPFYSEISKIADETAKELNNANFSDASHIIATKIGKGVGASLREQIISEVKNLKASDFNSPASAIGEALAQGTFGLKDNQTIFGKIGESVNGLFDTDKHVKEIEAKRRAEANLKIPGVTFSSPQTGSIVDSFFKIQPVIPNIISGIAGIKREADKVPDLSKLLAPKSAEEQIKSLKIALESSLGSLDISGKISQASIANHLDFTDADRLKTFRLSSAQTAQDLNKQIGLQAAFFNQELNLYKDDKDKTADITNEKNKVLGNLNGELRVNELTAQKQIKEYEQQIYDQRRRAAIEFKQLQIRESQFKVDVKVFDVGRTQTGFDELIKLTKNSFTELSRLTHESYFEQLKDQTLTREQRFNLTKQFYLDETKLAEDARRAIIGIEEKQYQQSISRLKENIAAQQSLLSSKNQIQSSLLGTVFGSENFSVFKAKGYETAFTALPQMQDYLRVSKEINDATKEKNSLDEKSVGFAENLNGLSNQILALESERAGQLIENPQLEYYKQISKINKDLLSDTSKINAQTIDALNQRVLKEQQLSKLRQADSLITETSKLLEAANDPLAGKGTPEEVRGFVNQINQLKADRAVLITGFIDETAKQFNQSIDGLKDAFALLRDADAGAVAAVKNIGEKALWSEKISLITSVINLENSYYKDSELWALRRKETLLNANREIYEAEQNAILSQIESQVKLAHQTDVSFNQISAKVKEHLASQVGYSEAISNGIISIYDKTASSLDKVLDKTGIGKIPILGDLAKAQSRNILSNITSGLLNKFGFDSFKSTGNPVLDENIKQTNALKEIAQNTSGLRFGGGGGSLAAGVGGIGGGLSSLLGSVIGRGRSQASGAGNLSAGNVDLSAIFGGGSSSSGSSSNGGVFNNPNIIKNLVGGGIGSNGSRTGDVLNGVTQVFAGDKGRQDVFSNLKRLFSTKDGGLLGKGGIFGKDGFGKNVGTFSTVGAGVGFVGNLISSKFGGSAVGRRLGGILSGAGAGLALGAQIGLIIPGIGTVIGAGVGAAIGAIVGFLGSGGQRKKDEKARSVAMSDAVSSIKNLVDKVRGDRIDGADAIGQAADIRANYLTQVGQLKDNKTRKIALRSVSEIDYYIGTLKSESARQTQRKERLQSLVPTFADGGQVSKFISSNYRNNPLGFVRGAGTSRSDSVHAYFPAADTFAKISHSEYVLDAETVKNVGVQNLDRLRQTKGKSLGDISRLMKYIREPRSGFADGGSVSPIASQSLSPASGNSNGATPTTSHTQVNIYLSEDGTLKDVETKTYLKTPEGEKLIESIIEKNIYRNGRGGKIPVAIARHS